MTALRFIAILVLLCISLGARAKKKQDYPQSEIKVGYNYYNKFLRGNDGVVEKNTPFILLANQEQSKFCGLPGLIMEASEPSGQHCFIVTGIEASTQPIFPVFNTEYEKMDRKEMLRALRHYRENSNAMFKAATGTELGGVDAPVTEETRKYDYLETDYHE